MKAVVKAKLLGHRWLLKARGNIDSASAALKGHKSRQVYASRIQLMICMVWCGVVWCGMVDLEVCGVGAASVASSICSSCFLHCDVIVGV